MVVKRKFPRILSFPTPLKFVLLQAKVQSRLLLVGFLYYQYLIYILQTMLLTQQKNQVRCNQATVVRQDRKQML